MLGYNYQVGDPKKSHTGNSKNKVYIVRRCDNRSRFMQTVDTGFDTGLVTSYVF